MKTLVYTLITVMSVIAFSCHEGNPTTEKPQTANAAKEENPEDSALNEVISIHDEVMPKMGKNIGYQKKAQSRVDSIVTFLKKADITAQAAKPATNERDSLNKVIVDLKFAEKEMNDWMEAFVIEPKMPTTAERLAYFQDQKQKALTMKEHFFAALEKAKALLGE